MLAGRRYLACQSDTIQTEYVQSESDQFLGWEPDSKLSYFKRR